MKIYFIVCLVCFSSISTPSQEPLVATKAASYGSGMSAMPLNDNKQVLDIAVRDNETWYTTLGGTVHMKREREPAVQLTNRHQTQQSFPAHVATCGSNKVCFGSDILQLHSRTPDHTYDSTWQSPSDCFTAIRFSHDGGHVIATLANKLQYTPSSKLVCFAIENDTLQSDPECEFTFTNTLPVRLCALTENPSSNSRIAVVQDTSTIRVLHFDSLRTPCEVRHLFEHKPQLSRINDIAWVGDTLLCSVTNQGLNIKSYMGGDELVFLSTSVSLGAVLAFEGMILAGTKDGCLMLLDKDGHRVKVRSTVQLSKAGKSLEHLLDSTNAQAATITALVFDKPGNDLEGTYLDWPPVYPSSVTQERECELKIVKHTLIDLLALTKVSPPLSGEICKVWLKRLGVGVVGGLSALYVLYWLTYCSEQGTGSLCP